MSRYSTRKHATSISSDKPRPQRHKGDTSSVIALETLTSHQTLRSIPHEQAYYVLVNPQPTPEMASTRLPLNLCLLVDRSTSMRGERIRQVKRAINHIVDKLEPNDTISLVTFSDRPQVLLPSQNVSDVAMIRSIVSAIQPSGSTEILPGLEASLEEIKRNRSEASINHLILLTDGHTYGDEAACLEQAKWAGNNQIHFSAIGLGHDWNEDFLDEIASLSGGTAIYIDQPNKVEHIFDETVKNLETAVARELTMLLEINPKVQLHEAYQILPHIKPLIVEGSKASLGLLSADQMKSVLLEFRVQRLPPGHQQMMRVTVEADIPHQKMGRSWEWVDITADITESPELNPSVPSPVRIALKKLSVFKMQTQIDDDLRSGDVKRATQRLQIMATRLFDLGEKQLAQTAMQEAKQLAQTGVLSSAGSKRIRYGTRRLSI